MQAVTVSSLEQSPPEWAKPLGAVLLYPAWLLAFDWALNRYHASASPVMAVAAVATMLLVGSVPVLAARALLRMRGSSGSILARGMLYLMFTAPSLFTLTLTLTRVFGMTQRHVQIGVWLAAWLAVGLVLYFRVERSSSVAAARPVRWLRIVHGCAALCLLCGFLLAHLSNHLLAMVSVEMHRQVMNWLRLWYRSDWVEPGLLALLLTMIGTGVPMVLHYSRQRMDGFRVVQAATGIYVAVFICSHVAAVLIGRSRGVETDWYFAAGPNSLLDGTSLLSRLIPHYVCGTFFFIVHVACGLRVVLLQHGVRWAVGNRVAYGVTAAGVAITTVIVAALLGWHFDTAG
jgi:hypothetical protein